MNRKYRRQLELGIVALALSALALLYLVVAIGIYMAANRQNVTPLSRSLDSRPSIGHCINNPDVEIWACVRDNPKPSKAAEYRKKMKREDV